MKFFRKLEASCTLAPKLVYLVVNMHFYGFHQMRFAFARDKFNISDNQYGKYTGYIQFITFFTNVLIGGVSDRTRRHRPILMLLVVGSTAIFVHFYISPLMKLHSAMFWAVLLLYLAFNNPKQPLLDKIMIEHLESFSPSSSKIYGRQRLWGTLSLSLSTYISEWCTSKKDGSFDFKYLIHYNVLATIMAMLAVMLLVKGKNSTEQPSANNDVCSRKNTIRQCPECLPQSDVSRPNAFIELIKNREFLFFIMVIFSNAITRSALTIYLSIFHKEILLIKPYELPDTWPALLRSSVGMLNNKPIATLATSGIVLEVVVMFLSERILSSLGFFWPLILAQIASLVRFMAYYFVTPQCTHAYGLSCLIELLRGLYFGLIHISSVHIAPRLAPLHLKATSQMIYQGTFSALGSLASGCIFGSMLELKIKGGSMDAREAVYRQIFLVNSMITFATILVCLAKYGMRDRVLFNREAEDAKLSSYALDSCSAKL